MNRTQKFKLNLFTSLILQFVTLVCGFILPSLTLNTYGSEVNGLINSITQFLGVISLLDFGIGAVVQSSLYKPLSDNDEEQISKIYVSAKKFFEKIATILLLYTIILIFIFPFIINKKFDFGYTAFLIFSISINSFSLYYFGVVNGFLLSAAQKLYIKNISQIITITLNAISCFILMKKGFSIQIVKLTTSLIYLIRPLFLSIYVNKNYNINKKINYSEEPIKQKWNGVAQHLAYFVLGSTDNIVLSMLSTLENVSVYSVYNIVLLGVKNIVLSLTSGFQSLLGDMLAKKEHENIGRFFNYMEWIVHTGTTLIFGCTGILIVNFIKVYTKGINDANYIQPLFAVLITMASAGECLRIPYNASILAAGHYKQTQNSYIIAMILNIVISIVTVKIFGLIGVAIGTLIAMIYQTVWMAKYISKNIINSPFKNFMKHIIVDILTIIIATFLTYKIPMNSISYYSWIILAFKIFFYWLFVTILINYILYKEYILKMVSKKQK